MIINQPVSKQSVVSKTDAPPHLVCLDHLRSMYGLSDSWIERLGEADALKPNPHYKCAAPMRLYSVERVERYLDEHDVEYRRHLEKRAKMSASATSTAIQKADQAIQWALTVEIEIPEQLPNDLVAQCNRRLTERDCFREVNERDVVNMIRHEYTNYHDYLEQLYGLIGRGQAYYALKSRFNAAIHEQLGLTIGGDC